MSGWWLLVLTILLALMKLSVTYDKRPVSLVPLLSHACSTGMEAFDLKETLDFTRRCLEDIYPDHKPNYQIAATSSCSFGDGMNNIQSALADANVGQVVIGPSQVRQCPMVTTWALYAEFDLVTFVCMAQTSVSRAYTVLATLHDLTLGLLNVLKYSRWGSVMIVYQDLPDWQDIAHEVIIRLMKQKILLTSITTVTETADANATFDDIFIHEPKAVLLFMNTSLAAKLLISAAEIPGVLSGSTVLIFIDPLMYAVDTIRSWRRFLVDIPGFWSSSHSVLLFTIHPAGRQLTMNATILDTGIQMGLAAAITFATAGKISAYNQKRGSFDSRNISVPFLHLLPSHDNPTSAGHNYDEDRMLLSTTLDGNMALDFYLLDIDLKTPDLVPVHMLPWPNFPVNPLEQMQWPNGSVGPVSDVCFLGVCPPTTGFTSVHGLILIATILFLLSMGLLIVYFVRRRYQIRAMHVGPNKIILSEEDIVFLRDNDLSGASVRTLDIPGVFDDDGRSVLSQSINDPNTAKYMGDFVHVKYLDTNEAAMKSKFRNFIRNLRDLRHENINLFIGCFIDPRYQSLSLVFDHAGRGSLDIVIQNKAVGLDWEFKLSLMTDLVKGMRYLHSSSIRVHGSLKSSNCVVDGRYVLKITDYGLMDIYSIYGCKRKYEPKDLLWTAPELLRDEGLRMRGTQKGDIYSFSIIMQEILIRDRPFAMLGMTPTEVLNKVRRPPPLCRPQVSNSEAPPSYILLMKTCWAEIPDIRPDFESITKQIKDLNDGKKINIVDHMFKIMDKYAAELTEQVNERTRELESEKRRTEILIARMLPSVVAKSLMMGKAVRPESYDAVTIYFSDIVGFTTISAMSTSLEVIDFLNDLYTVFDSTIDYYDVYKVETIGDAYMVVSGLPERNGRQHAYEIATMSLDLLSQCGYFQIRHMPDVPLRVRIGLHSGPCVAGVVGLTMPRYCLFGDTVNTASRMESTGLAFRIHVSPDTVPFLEDSGEFHLQLRGQVELKGKGLVDSYWLLGKQGFNKPLPEPPELSEEENHGLASIMKSEEQRKKTTDSTSNPSDNQDNSTTKDQPSDPSAYTATRSPSGSWESRPEVTPSAGSNFQNSNIGSQSQASQNQNHVPGWRRHASSQAKAEKVKAAFKLEQQTEYDENPEGRSPLKTIKTTMAEQAKADQAETEAEIMAEAEAQYRSVGRSFLRSGDSRSGDHIAGFKALESTDSGITLDVVGLGDCDSDEYEIAGHRIQVAPAVMEDSDDDNMEKMLQSL